MEAVLEQRRDAVALSAPLERRSATAGVIVVVCCVLEKWDPRNRVGLIR